MDHLSTATVPLTVLPSSSGTTYVMRVDEAAGQVRLDPVPLPNAGV